MSDREEKNYAIRFTCNMSTYHGSHITEYGADRAAALADFRPDKLIQVELLECTVTYGEWRPASKGTAEVNMYPASDVKSVETGASTITIKPLTRTTTEH